MPLRSHDNREQVPLRLQMWSLTFASEAVGDDNFSCPKDK